MSKKRLGKRIVAFAVAATMTLSTALTGGFGGKTVVHAAESTNLPTRYDSSSAVNYSTILGRGVDFGVIADSFVQKGHMQTTFATLKFANYHDPYDQNNLQYGQFNAVDLIEPGSTGQILIGSVDTSGDRAPVPIVLDNPKSGRRVHIEAPAEVIGSYDGTVSNGYFYTANINNRTEFVDALVNESTVSNIKDIHTRAKDASEMLSAKASDEDYRINYKDYFTKTDGGDINNWKILDFSNPAFDNRVIYIDVDNDLLKKIGNGGFEIIKNSSSVIVFNISPEAGTNQNDSIFLSQYKVTVKDENVKTETTEYSDYDKSRNCDEEIAQKVIWNVTSKKKVFLHNTTGLFLVPNSEQVDISGTSAGWIVTKNFQNSNGEWHYIYAGGSQDVPVHKPGQMHFAIDKAYTYDWNNGNPVADTSLIVDPDTFTFEWYEVKDDSYDTTDFLNYKTTQNKSTSKIQLPIETFYSDSEHSEDSHYVPEGTTKSFYYVLKEKNAGEYVKGIGISKGYVNIKLDVTNKNGKITFSVTYDTYLGDEKNTKSDGKVNDPLAGVEYDLDNFFNKIGTDVEIDKVSVAGGEEISDATLVIRRLDGETFDSEYPTVSARNIATGDKVQLSYVDKVLGSENEYKAVSYVTTGDHTIVSGLADGKYSLTEIINPKGYAIAEPIVFEVENGVVKSQSPDVNDNKIVMIDEYRTSVAFSKLDASNMEEIAGAEIQLYGVNEDGPIVFTADNFEAGKGAKDFELLDEGQTLKFISGTEASIFKDLPDGKYVIHEEVAPEGYVVATEIYFYIYAGKVFAGGDEVTATYTVGEGDNKTTLPLIEMEDDVMTVKISKVDLNGTEVEGAKIKVTTDKKKLIDEWISGSDVHEIKNISAGKYILTEEAAPEGYEKIKTAINFTVDKYGNVTVDSADTTGLAVVENGVLVIKNAPQKHGVLVSKVDAGGTEIAGAKITVTKKGETNPIDSWTSEENVIHEIKDLEAGNYILKEVNAPAGYDAVNSEIEFSVNKKGEVEIVSSVTDGVTIDENGVIVITNNPTEYAVSISKVDAEGTEIAGAEITVTKKGETTPIDSWTSEEGKTHTIEGVTFGDYVFTEINAPEGYKPVNSNIEFTVNKDGSVTVTSSNTDGLVEVENGVIKIKNLPKEYDVAIKKTDLAGVEIAGAEIKVTKDDADKTLVDSWTSEEGKNHIIKGVTFGDYILTEVNAPEGYDGVTTEIKFTVNKDGSVSLNGTYTNAKVNFYGALQITNEPTKYEVSISKKDAVSGDEIGGAEIKVTKTDADKTLVDSWTSVEDETHIIKGITFGEYILTEVNAPEGYDKVTTEVIFSVDKQGKVTVKSTDTNGLVEVNDQGVLVIKNIPYVHGVLISKQDLESGDEIGGAEIKITKADDDTAVVDSWTSEAEKKHEIQNIVAGDYVLIEETSPEGYVKVTSKIEFTVDENGKITVTSKETDGVAEVDKNGVLVIKNAPVKHEVAISKVDATDGSKELEGATIVIYNEKKAVVDTWVSADAPHVSKISAGRYTLKETVAPDDYDVVESEVIFDVDKVGNVTLVSAATNGEYELSQDGTIIIKDSPIKKYDVNISKQDLESGDEIGGAEIKVTKADDDSAVIDSWTSVEDETHTIKDVVAGDYILTEVNAPEGYEKVTTEIKFTVDKDGKVTVTSKDTDGLAEVDENGRLVIKNKPEKKEDDKFDVNISKQDLESGDEIGGAEIVVTKDDKDKTPVDSWTSVKDKTHTIKDVVAGDYILTEVNAPEGYEKVTTEIKFTVDKDGKVTVTSQDTDGLVEVDANGRLVIKNKPEKKEDDKFDVNISKQDLDTGDEIPGAEIVVTKDDKDKTPVDSWTSVKDETHTIKDVVAGDYILTEVNAPEGYEKVTTEIKFTVDKDGKVTVTSKDTDGLAKVDEETGKLIIFNKPEKKPEEKFDVNISKQDLESGDEIGGAEIVVTKDDKDKTPVDSWTSVKDETHTIKDVTPGEYILTEVNAPEGYEKVTTEIKFKVDENGKVTVTSKDTDGLAIVDANGRLIIKNKPIQKTGSLVITKSFANDCITDEEKEGALKFTVTTEKDNVTYYLAADGSLTADKTVYTLEPDFTYDAASNTWTKTFDNVPVGIYTVEEVNSAIEGYEFKGSTFNGVAGTKAEIVVDADTKATEAIVDDYTRETGNLIITKLVKGPVTEEEFNGALTFKVVDEKGNPITVTKNDGTTGTSENMTIKDYFQPVSQANGEFTYELRLESVPTGKYTVTETNTTLGGYELVSQTGGGDTNVVSGKDTVEAFTDEYNPVTGSLEIVKKFQDAPSNLDASKLVFKVEGPARFNNGEALTVSYDKFTDGKYVIKDAPIGKYTVTETSIEENLIDGNYKYSFNSGASTVSGTTEVIKDTQASISLKNVYDKEEILGSLTINKTVAMNDGSEVPADTFVSDKTFKVSVQNTDTGLYVSDANGGYSENPVWFDIKADSAVKINNIKLGNYTVSEDVADATRVDYRIIYDGSASTSEAKAALSVDAKDGNVTISNVYKHYEEEEIIDYPVFFSKEDSLSGAEVAGAGIALYKGDKAEGTPYKTWTSTLTSHVENLEEGTYTFKETVAPTGYDIVETAITFTVEKDETADKGYSVKLIDLSDEVCYQRQDGTLVLKDDPMLGILKVVKVVETNTGNKPVVDGFNVTVKNLKNNKYVQSVDGKLGDEAKDIFVPIDSTGVGSVEITGLRPARYLVVEKEDGKAVKGFVYDANGSIAELEEEIALTDTGATTAEVELTNKYVEDIGSLSITKKLTGDNPGKTEFKVTVKNSDGKFLTADGKLSDSETVLTVKAGETLTINNVPSGKYTVAEDVTDASKVTGYKFNSENSVSAKDATVTQGSIAAVELINDYTEVPTGNLYVHVKEEKSGKDVPDATVTVTNKTTGDTTEYKTNEKGEIVDNNGKTPELPEGEYTVVVSDVPKGYEVTTGESADVTVPKNDTGRHEAVIKTTRGGIIITVYDEETGNVVPGAEVTITTPDGVTKTFVTDSDGQVKEYAKKDQFDNYTQLPGTFTYVVTKVPEGYKVTTGESQTGTVVADKLTELVAKIAPKTGGLDIKVVDEKTGNPVENATVEVNTPDGKTVEILTDKDGMITKFVEKDSNGNYTAKVGEYKITVTKVPEGYSVTTGQTKTETVVEGQVKHHVARIATATQKKITDTDTTNNNTTTNKTNTSKKTDTNAKTADEADVAGAAGLMIISLAAVAVIVRRKKEDEE